MSDDALRKEIEGEIESFVAAYNAKDVEKIGQFYTEDCTVLPPGAPTAKGRKEAAAVYESIMKKGAVKVSMVIQEVGPLGAVDSCYERSNYTFYKENNEILMAGRYVAVWKKVKGNWMLYIDCLSPL